MLFYEICCGWRRWRCICEKKVKEECWRGFRVIWVVWWWVLRVWGFSRELFVCLVKRGRRGGGGSCEWKCRRGDS